MLINHPLFVSQWLKSVQVMITLLITWYHGLWICIQFIISDFGRGDWKSCLQGKWTIFIYVNIASVLVYYNADICIRVYQCSVNDYLSMFRLDYLRYRKYFEFCYLSCCWQSRYLVLNSCLIVDRESQWRHNFLQFVQYLAYPFSLNMYLHFHKTIFWCIFWNILLACDLSPSTVHFHG